MSWTDEERQRISAAYADVLDEPVPDRITAMLAQPAPGTAAPVVDLAAERARRAAPRMAPRAFGSWAQWGGMAASVLVGVLVGMQLSSRNGGDALLAEKDGRVIAGSRLAQGLDTRLASEPAEGVAVQLSFRDRAGRYCRTFSAEQVAGLACRDGAQWAVTTTAQVEPGKGTAMRQAASSLPKAVLGAVDASIAGTALDAAAERRARDGGWK